MEQEKGINLSPIRRRMYNYLRIKKIRHIDFFQKTGLSEGTFKAQNGKSELRGEALSCILKHYPNISAHWLLTGEGPMERSTNISSIQIQNKVLGSNNVVAQGTASISENIGNPDNNTLKDELISELRSHIEYLKGEIKRKDEIISQLLSVKLTPKNEE